MVSQRMVHLQQKGFRMDQEERMRFYAKLLVEYINTLDPSNHLVVVAAVEGFEAGLLGSTYINTQTAFGPLPNDALLAKVAAYVEGRKHHHPMEGEEL